MLPLIVATYNPFVCIACTLTSLWWILRREVPPSLDAIAVGFVLELQTYASTFAHTKNVYRHLLRWSYYRHVVEHVHAHAKRRTSVRVVSAGVSELIEDFVREDLRFELCCGSYRCQQTRTVVLCVGLNKLKRVERRHLGRYIAYGNTRSDTELLDNSRRAYWILPCGGQIRSYRNANRTRLAHASSRQTCTTKPQSTKLRTSQAGVGIDS